MEIPKIHEGEYRFCLIMWEHEPIAAAQLVKLCQEQNFTSNSSEWSSGKPESRKI